MDLQQFIQNTSGKAVTYDGLKINYGQCEQLVCLYWKDVYGFATPSIPYAKDLITNPTVLGSFNVIPAGQEQANDVAVFGASSSIGSPVAGHTDIVLQGQTGGGFLGWDSNWGGVTDKNQGTPGFGYPAAHQVQHSYNDVIGFLRFKAQGDDEMVTNIDAWFERWQRLGRQVRGRIMGSDEFRNAAVGRTWTEATDILSNDPEADTNTQMADLGREVTSEKWLQNIKDLNADITKLKGSSNTQAIVTDLQAVINKYSS